MAGRSERTQPGPDADSLPVSPSSLLLRGQGCHLGKAEGQAWWSLGKVSVCHDLGQGGACEAHGSA